MIEAALIGLAIGLSPLVVVIPWHFWQMHRIKARGRRSHASFCRWVDKIRAWEPGEAIPVWEGEAKR